MALCALGTASCREMYSSCMGLRTVVLINVLPTAPAAMDREILPYYFNDVKDVIDWTVPVHWPVHRYAGTISLNFGADMVIFAIKTCRQVSLCSRRCNITNITTNFRAAVRLFPVNMSTKLSIQADLRHHVTVMIDSVSK
jgi:hypothetical protein